MSEIIDTILSFLADSFTFLFDWFADFFKDIFSTPIGRPEAGTALSLPHSRIASIFSGLVCDKGTTLFIAFVMFSTLRTKLGFAIDLYDKSLIVDSRSAPVKPSVNSTILSEYGPEKSRSRYFLMYKESISLRSDAVGKSTKNSSSKRPRLRSSDGSIETSLAVATTNTCFFSTNQLNYLSFVYTEKDNLIIRNSKIKPKHQVSTFF